ncbi:UAP56-interacting factor [Camelus ferus]|nr:UAP56-interacting factor [Camelus ferus]
MRVRWGLQQNSGFGKNNLSRRGRVMPGKRRPYGVITGLAARKATGIRKGISPMNRPLLSDKVQAQLNTEQLLDDVVAKRTRQTQKPRLTRTAVPSFLTKREQSDVKKVPKGVPLQFDINSVGKQGIVRGLCAPFPAHPSSGCACAEPAGRRVVGWEMAATGLVSVATAAEYSGPGASGGNLSSNCGPNSGAGPGPGPGSWSRSLDRALAAPSTERWRRRR